MSTRYIVTLAKEIVVIGGTPSEARQAAMRRHTDFRVSHVRTGGEELSEKTWRLKSGSSATRSMSSRLMFRSLQQRSTICSKRSHSSAMLNRP